MFYKFLNTFRESEDANFVKEYDTEGVSLKRLYKKALKAYNEGLSADKRLTTVQYQHLTAWQLLIFEEPVDSLNYEGNVFDMETGLMCYKLPTIDARASSSLAVFAKCFEDRTSVMLTQMMSEFEDLSKEGANSIFSDFKEGNAFVFSKKQATNQQKRQEVKSENKPPSSSMDVETGSLSFQEFSTKYTHSVTLKRAKMSNIANVRDSDYKDLVMIVLEELYTGEKLDYIASVLDRHRGYCHRAKEASQPLPEHLKLMLDANVSLEEKKTYLRTIVGIVDDVLETLDTSGRRSTLKSLLQKLVRLRSAYVDLNFFHLAHDLIERQRTPTVGGYKVFTDTLIPTDIVIVMTVLKMARSEGEYNARIKRVVTGLESLYSRLATILVEDSYVTNGCGIRSYFDFKADAKAASDSDADKDGGGGKKRKAGEGLPQLVNTSVQDSANPLSLPDRDRLYDVDCSKKLRSRMVRMRLYDVFYKTRTGAIMEKDSGISTNSDDLEFTETPSDENLDMRLFTTNTADDVSYLLGNAMYMKHTPSKVHSYDVLDMCYVVRIALNAWCEVRRMRYASGALKLKHRDFYGHGNFSVAANKKSAEIDTDGKSAATAGRGKKRKTKGSAAYELDDDVDNVFHFKLNGKCKGYRLRSGDDGKTIRKTPDYCYSHVVSACLKTGYGGLKGSFAQGVFSGDARMFYSVAFEHPNTPPKETLREYFENVGDDRKTGEKLKNDENKLYVDSGFFDVMPIQHCMDQHCYSEIGYAFSKDLVTFCSVIKEHLGDYGLIEDVKKKLSGAKKEDFHDLFEFIFCSVSGQNPRLTNGGLKRSLIYGNLEPTIAFEPELGVVKTRVLACDYDTHRVDGAGKRSITNFVEDGDLAEDYGFDVGEYISELKKKEGESDDDRNNFAHWIRLGLYYIGRAILYAQTASFASHVSKNAKLPVSSPASNRVKVQNVSKILKSDIIAFPEGKDLKPLTPTEYKDVVYALSSIYGVPSYTLYGMLEGVPDQGGLPNYLNSANGIEGEDTYHDARFIGGAPKNSIGLGSDNTVKKGDMNYQRVETASLGTEFICGSIPLVVCRSSANSDSRFRNEISTDKYHWSLYNTWCETRTRRFDGIHGFDDVHITSGKMDSSSSAKRLANLLARCFNTAIEAPISDTGSGFTSDMFIDKQQQKDRVEPMQVEGAVITEKREPTIGLTSQPAFDWYRFLFLNKDVGATTIPSELSALLDFRNYVFVPKTTTPYGYALVKNLEPNLVKMKIIKRDRHAAKASKDANKVALVTDILTSESADSGEISTFKIRIGESVMSATLETYHKRFVGVADDYQKSLYSFERHRRKLQHYLTANILDKYYTSDDAGSALAKAGGIVNIVGKLFFDNALKGKSILDAMVKVELDIAKHFSRYEFECPYDDLDGGYEGLYAQRGEAIVLEAQIKIQNDMGYNVSKTDDKGSAKIVLADAFCATADYVFSNRVLTRVTEGVNDDVTDKKDDGDTKGKKKKIKVSMTKKPEGKSISSVLGYETVLCCDTTKIAGKITREKSSSSKVPKLFNLSDLGNQGAMPNFADVVTETIGFTTPDYSNVFQNSRMAMLNTSDVAFALTKSMMLKKDVWLFFVVFSRLNLNAGTESLNEQIHAVCTRDVKDPKGATVAPDVFWIKLLTNVEFLAVFNWLLAMNIDDDYRAFVYDVVSKINAISSDETVRTLYDARFYGGKDDAGVDNMGEIAKEYANLVSFDQSAATAVSVPLDQPTNDKGRFAVAWSTMISESFIRFVFYALHKSFMGMYSVGTSDANDTTVTAKVKSTIKQKYVHNNDRLGFISYERSGKARLFRWYDCYGPSPFNGRLLTKYYRRLSNDVSKDHDIGRSRTFYSMLVDELETWSTNNATINNAGILNRAFSRITGNGAISFEEHLKRVQFIRKLESFGIFVRTREHENIVKPLDWWSNVGDLEPWFVALYLRCGNASKLAKWSKDLSSEKLLLQDFFMGFHDRRNVAWKFAKRSELGIMSLERAITFSGDGVLRGADDCLARIVASGVYDRGDWLAFYARYMVSWMSTISFPKIGLSGSGSDEPAHLYMIPNIQIMQLLAFIYPAFIKRMNHSPGTSHDTKTFKILNLPAFKKIGAIILEAVKRLYPNNEQSAIEDRDSLKTCWFTRYDHGILTRVDERWYTMMSERLRESKDKGARIRKPDGSYIVVKNVNVDAPDWDSLEGSEKVGSPVVNPFKRVILTESGSRSADGKRVNLKSRNLYDYQKECVVSLLERRGTQEIPQTKGSFLRLDVGAGKTSVIFGYFNELLKKGLMCPYVIYLTQLSAISSLLMEARNFGFKVNVVTPRSTLSTKLFVIAGKVKYDCANDPDKGAWLTINAAAFEAGEGGVIKKSGVTKFSDDGEKNFLPFAINVMDYDAAKDVDISTYRNLSGKSFNEKDFEPGLLESIKFELKRRRKIAGKNTNDNFGFERMAGTRGYILLGDEIHDTLRTMAGKRENTLEMLDRATECILLTGTPIANQDSADLIMRFLMHCVGYPVSEKNIFTAMESMVSSNAVSGRKVNSYILDVRKGREYKLASKSEWMNEVQKKTMNSANDLDYLYTSNYANAMVGKELESSFDDAYEKHCLQMMKKFENVQSAQAPKKTTAKKDNDDVLQSIFAKAFKEQSIYGFKNAGGSIQFYSNWTAEEWRQRSEYHEKFLATTSKQKIELLNRYVAICKIVQYRVQLSVCLNEILAGNAVLMYADTTTDLELVKAMVQNFVDTYCTKEGKDGIAIPPFNFEITAESFDYRSESDKEKKNLSLVVMPSKVNTGFNMTNCNVVVHPVLDPTAYKQAVGRVDRIGQMRDVRLIGVYLDYYLAKYVARIIGQEITNKNIEQIAKMTRRDDLNIASKKQ